MNMLQIKNRTIVNERGESLLLRGVALGGWLMMEGYMLGGENIPESKFKKELAENVGTKLADEFTWEFRKRFITPKDARVIKKMGFNCVRLPFNCRLVEEEGGLEFLEYAVKMFAAQNLYVILDMHAVPGSQNPDWHADCLGVPLFFEEKTFQVKYFDLWKKLSARFKNYGHIAGYDVMNEPVTEKIQTLRSVYAKAIEIIRGQNDDHIVFLEGNQWARDVDFITDIISDNLAYSIHFYDPFNFVWHKEDCGQYPGLVGGEHWDKKLIGQKLSYYADLQAPIYAGEFGLSSLCPSYQWLEEVLEIFDKFKFHWTFWTCKSAAGLPFPDGLFQSFDKVNLGGMPNIASHLLENKEEFYGALDTKNFKLNDQVWRLLSSYLG